MQSWGWYTCCCSLRFWQFVHHPLGSPFFDPKSFVPAREGHINLRKSPGHRPGVPGTPGRTTDRKGQFCRDTGRVSQGHPAIQGVSENLCDFFLSASFAPYLWWRYVVGGALKQGDVARPHHERACRSWRCRRLGEHKLGRNLDLISFEIVRDKKGMGMAMFKRTFAWTIPDNLREPHMKMWGFEARRARKFTRTSPRTLPWNFITMLSAPHENWRENENTIRCSKFKTIPHIKNFVY